ncbi:SUKH-4 family immunity protein [Streptomyces sp. NPDC059008]|uniref:SUKH-4 family immunity protein n=1 Tax=Streptomyces sp. NPDC059008 TaxID=3346693 RepID=UPI0036B20BE9
MTERDRAVVNTPDHETVSLLSEWWRSWRAGGNCAHLVDPSGSAGAAVLKQLHQQIEGSVLVDAAGRTAEEVQTEMLRQLGVDVSPAGRWDWHSKLDQLDGNRLVLVLNAHRAGRTRSSSETDHLLTRAIDRLIGGRVGVLVHITPDELLPLSEVVLNLPERNTAEADWPAPLRALALAQPRIVPLRVWAELTAALGPESVTITGLRDLLEEFSDHLVSGDQGVSFSDEGLAEELRRGATDEEINRVDRHMVEWLRRISPEFRHPEGWARSGPEGLYAATGLAMHAVQADSASSVSAEAGDQGTLFEDLLQDGGALANIPQTTLLDAADCAFAGDIPGNTAAGSAVQLWSYGVIPESQPEWAAWLHLMATARGDRDLADAVADSSVHLPWKTNWARWRPPGGYHWRFLDPGPAEGLTEVRWQGRPAVATLFTWTSRVDVWDAANGEHLGGPWREEIPEEHHSDLSWPPESASEEGMSGEGLPGPETYEDLEDAMSDEESAHDLLLGSPVLRLGSQVILAGSGGLFAIEPTAGEHFSGLNSPNVKPLSGRFALTTAITPVGSPPPGLADLVELYGADHIHAFPAHTLPDGLTDEATRNTLIEFGLPEFRDEDGMGIYPLGDHRMSVFDEVSWPSDIASVEETGPFFQIGFWMGGQLVIDGPTGHVLRVPAEPDEEHLAGLPAAHSLENFLTMVALWVTGHLTKGLVEGDDEAALLPAFVRAAHLRIDPVGAEASAWAYAFHSQ